MRALRRLQHLWNARREARELAEEMEAHRAMLEAEQRADGLSADEARHAAHRAMGNLTQAQEASRGVWIVMWLESVWQDLRYAARSLASQPGFTGMALLALVLAIGLNTGLFTIINAVMFRTWDVPDADRMVRVQQRTKGGSLGGGAVRGVQYLQRESKTMDGVFIERPMAMRIGNQATAYAVDFVSGSYFPTLRIGMALGRGFGEQEDAEGDPKPVLVLNHTFWERQFAADPSIVGRTVNLDDVPFTVVGVAPKSFRGTNEDAVDMWAPLQSMRLARPNDEFVRNLLTSEGWCCSAMGGRIKPGIDRAQAQAELHALYNQYLTGAKQSRESIVLGSTSFYDLDDGPETLPILVMLLGGVGSILLLACANVSNLLLARASARSQEIAIRTAIGAGRWRVIRQLLTESLLLAGIASACGLALAYWLPEVVLRLLDAPEMPSMAPDGRVLAYVVGITVVTALLFGLAPALQGTRMATGTRSTTRSPLRGLLLGSQVAISAVLLIGAGLLARGIQKVQDLDLGFRIDGVSAVSVVPPANRYSPERQLAFYLDLQERLTAANQGRPVALSVLTPLGQSSSITEFRLPGQKGKERTIARVQWVSPGYFDLLKIPVLAGRDFTARDRTGDAILINEALARNFWPDSYPQRSPIGQTVQIGKGTPLVIGIVRDSKVYGIGDVPPTYFAPFTPDLHWAQPVALVPSSLASTAVAIAREMEPLAATQAISLSGQLNQSIGGARAGAQAATGLGLLALLLATVGVYGVISYSVEQRRKEIGIRIALGARSAEVIALVLRRNAPAILIGLCVGLLLAGLVSGAMESYLFGVSPLDPIAYAGVLGVLLAAGALASFAPARKAAKTDPLKVLQTD